MCVCTISVNECVYDVCVNVCCICVNVYMCDVWVNVSGVCVNTHVYLCVLMCLSSMCKCGWVCCIV